jgi:hypothetical protein
MIRERSPAEQTGHPKSRQLVAENQNLVKLDPMTTSALSRAKVVHTRLRAAKNGEEPHGKIFRAISRVTH